MLLGVTSVAFFVTGVQSAVTSYELCVYFSGDGTCKNEVSCTEMCMSEGTNICPYYTCDCMEDAFGITFGECKVVAAGSMSMDQKYNCIEDGTDPEPYEGNDICSIVADDSPTEPEPSDSDDSPTEPEPEPSYDSPTRAPSYEPSQTPTNEPSYAPCENSALCETHCPDRNGTCTAGTADCTTTGWDYEDGYANCTMYYELLSRMYMEFEEWGKCFYSG